MAKGCAAPPASIAAGPGACLLCACVSVLCKCVSVHTHKLLSSWIDLKREHTYSHTQTCACSLPVAARLTAEKLWADVSGVLPHIVAVAYDALMGTKHSSDECSLGQGKGCSEGQAEGAQAEHGVVEGGRSTIDGDASQQQENYGISNSQLPLIFLLQR